MQSSRKQNYETEPQMDTDEHGSVIQAEKPLLAGKDFSSRNLRALGALRGFAVNPGFHREGAKHAKKTRRTLVWLRLGRSVFIRVHLWLHFLCSLRRRKFFPASEGFSH
ncbi:MAG: hypothetical protein DMG10_11820 [Acidobacteria bacterium]|nr:MAG: hypothetical protein DMG10_11820 [Acidobacteriota bacterium]